MPKTGERADATTTDALRAFAHRYGWRAYALPVLIVITIVALLTAGAAAHGTRTDATSASGPNRPQAPPTPTGDIALKSDQPGANAQNTALPADALPSGPAYTVTGQGTFRLLAGTSAVVGTGPLHRYDIEVENGISGIDLNQFAATVQSVLSDSRSWSGHGVALQRVDSGPVDFRVTLVSAMTVRKLCGYDIPIETSCYDAAGGTSPVNRVVLDDARWVRGDPAYVGDLDAYRLYMINHEDGHALGHEHAHECLADGLAPAMMQQTIGLRSAATGQLCQANPWPFPAGATDAPGAEQPDTAQNSQVLLSRD